MEPSEWLAAAIVADIGHVYDTTEFGTPFRKPPYLVIATTCWCDRWTKGRFDLPIVPRGQAELDYAEPVSAEIAKYAFHKHQGFATYRAVLGGHGAWVEKYSKWGQL